MTLKSEQDVITINKGAGPPHRVPAMRILIARRLKHMINFILQLHSFTVDYLIMRLTFITIANTIIPSEEETHAYSTKC